MVSCVLGGSCRTFVQVIGGSVGCFQGNPWVDGSVGWMFTCFGGRSKIQPVCAVAASEAAARVGLVLGSLLGTPLTWLGRSAGI